MNILVPTRNNPVALAGLLSSVIAWVKLYKPSLYLMDGSNDPVISDPYISRLLTRFDLHYEHFLEPQVNVQRLAGLTRLCFSSTAPVLMIDDDHVLLADPQPAIEAFRSQNKAKAYFGICPDMINDKGYSDFDLVTEEGGHHSLSPKFDKPRAVHCPSLKEFSANPGFLVTHAREAHDLLFHLHRAHRECPAVADDAMARALADPPYLHTSLQALHVGNNNKWWKGTAIKHKAVNLALEGLK